MNARKWLAEIVTKGKLKPMKNSRTVPKLLSLSLIVFLEWTLSAQSMDNFKPINIWEQNTPEAGLLNDLNIYDSLTIVLSEYSTSPYWGKPAGLYAYEQNYLVGGQIFTTQDYLIITPVSNKGQLFLDYIIPKLKKLVNDSDGWDYSTPSTIPAIRGMISPKIEFDPNQQTFPDKYSVNFAFTPEPEQYAAVFGFALLGTGVWLRRKKVQAVAAK